MVNITEEVKLRGYETIPQIIIPQQSLLNLVPILESPYLDQIPEKKDTMRNTRNNTIDFYESFFNLHRTPFILERKIGPIKIEKRGDIHPFGLPIKKVKDVDTFFGSLNEVMFLTEPYPTMYYKGVSLCDKPTEITKLAYTHEIAHTQLNYVRGLIKEYYNTEVISILLETIHALEADSSERLLYVHDSNRLRDLSYIIKELDKYHTKTEEDVRNVLIEGSLYLQSTLEAYNLFIKYYYGSIELKKEILSSIQALFNHEITLEDLLDSFDVSLESSIDVKTLSKYIRR